MILEMTKMWLVIPATARNTIDRMCVKREVLRKIKTTNKLIHTIRKRGLKFLGRIMKKEGLENLTFTGQEKKGKIAKKLFNV